MVCRGLLQREMPRQRETRPAAPVVRLPVTAVRHQAQAGVGVFVLRCRRPSAAFDERDPLGCSTIGDGWTRSETSRDPL